MSMRLAMDSRLMRGLFPVALRSLSQPKIAPPDGLRFGLSSPSIYQHPGFRGFNFFSSGAKNDTQTKASAPEEPPAAQAAPGEGNPEETEVEKTLRFELNKAVSENAKLLSKSREFEDKYMRALAETENLRTRLTKQINDSKLYAVQGFCKDMTEISDILRLAIESVPKEQLNDNQHLKNLYDGLSMTESRLLQVFKAHGLTQINPVDEKFNPNEHEAVVQQEIAGKESGTVVFVSKLGYKLHDRVIRPAVVGVAK